MLVESKQFGFRKRSSSGLPDADSSRAIAAAASRRRKIHAQDWPSAIKMGGQPAVAAPWPPAGGGFTVGQMGRPASVLYRHLDGFRSALFPAQPPIEDRLGQPGRHAAKGGSGQQYGKASATHQVVFTTDQCGPDNAQDHHLRFLFGVN